MKRRSETMWDNRCLVFNEDDIIITIMNPIDAKRYITDDAFAAQIEKQQKEAERMTFAAWESDHP